MRTWPSEQDMLQSRDATMMYAVVHTVLHICARMQ
jgi:hypothetical protein